MRKFPIKYKVEFGEHPSEDVKSEGSSACDELLLCSIVRFPDGKGSVAWHSSSGKPGTEVRTSTMFSAWLALGLKMSAQGDLNNTQREVVLNALNSSRTKTEKL